MSLPKSIELREDGPREGFQFLEHSVPTKEKIELIEMLASSGAKSIEVTSFVRPDLVPQHADADDLCRQLKKTNSRYRALYLNKKGLERALKHDVLELEGYIMLAASEKFLKENNNLTIAQAINGIGGWLDLFAEKNIKLERIMLSSVFGDRDSGKIEASSVLKIIAQILEKIVDKVQTLPEITLADTTGWGNPQSVKRLIADVKNAHPELPLGLHLHDTRGTGMANVLAGLEEGVSAFDCSVAGMGGCPFAKGAAGNVPTEDVAFLCEEMGIATGLDLESYIECAKFAEKIAGVPLPGKLKKGGLLASGKH